MLNPKITMAPYERKSGKLDLEVLYGHEDRLNYAIRHKFNVHLTNNPAHRGGADFHWEYADEPEDKPSD